jgi:hypothetical protein
MKLHGRLHRLRLWLGDEMYDPLLDRDAPDWLVEGVLSQFENASQKILCALFGHEPHRDMCLKPEHDHCIWCRKSMPGAAEPTGDRRLR